MNEQVATDASPARILSAIHGVIRDARLAHPDVLHLEIQDESGASWKFSTQDADWSPASPADLIGRTISDGQIDEHGALTFDLAGGSSLLVSPRPFESSDDPPTWELITPEGVHLEFGPGLSWRIESADARDSAP